MPSRPATSCRRSGGFTLVELLLTVGLLAGLFAAAVFGFSSLRRTAQLNEGVERVETAMRFARAHAANTGRKVQMVVSTTDATGIQGGDSRSGSTSGDTPGNAGSGMGEATPSLSILWEADPARAPGVFEPIPSLSAEVSDVSDLVEIRSVEKPTGTETAPDPGLAAASDPGSPAETTDSSPAAGTWDGLADAGPGTTTARSTPSGLAGDPIAGGATITFYPDGSCDGATLVLASRDADDAREVSLHLEGVTGATRRRWRETSASGIEAALQDQDPRTAATPQASAPLATAPSRPTRPSSPPGSSSRSRP
jgi:type II secretory pathway pseudopilin PulG